MRNVSNEDWLAMRVLELEEENTRLRRRLHMLAETIALLSAPETVVVSDRQFSLLAGEAS